MISAGKRTRTQDCKDLGFNDLRESVSSCGHVSGHIDDDSDIPPDDLIIVIRAWQYLDEIDRVRIMAIIRKASERAES